MFEKKLDNVLKVFKKVQEDLEVVMRQQADKSAEANVKIDDLKAEIFEADEAYIRAQSVSKKLEELLD